MIYTDVNNQSPTFTITDKSFYFFTLSTQDNAKLLPQLKSSFKRTINWNIYLTKPELLLRNQNLNDLIELSFQGENRLFLSAFRNGDQRVSSKGYYLPNV